MCFENVPPHDFLLTNVTEVYFMTEAMKPQLVFICVRFAADLTEQGLLRKVLFFDMVSQCYFPLGIVTKNCWTLFALDVLILGMLQLHVPFLVNWISESHFTITRFMLQLALLHMSDVICIHFVLFDTTEGTFTHFLPIVKLFNVFDYQHVTPALQNSVYFLLTIRIEVVEFLKTKKIHGHVHHTES